jgi:hypothetical protein
MCLVSSVYCGVRAVASFLTDLICFVSASIALLNHVAHH